MLNEVDTIHDTSKEIKICKKGLKLTFSVKGASIIFQGIGI